jgi:hypothetical protein
MPRWTTSTQRCGRPSGSDLRGARNELALGEALRRQRRRVEARTHLRNALEVFEKLGTAPWTERARAELRASGETARKHDPNTFDQLTPQEMRIALFASKGASNPDIAANCS